MNRAKKIADTYVQMSKEENEESELRSRIPEVCKLTMKDVIQVVENGKKFYVIEPHNDHLSILDSTNEHFKDRHNDRTKGRGDKRIGLFYGKNIAYTGDTADEWIVINREFAEHVKQLGKRRVKKVASVSKKSVKIAKGKSIKTTSECKRSRGSSCITPIALRDNTTEHPLDPSFVYDTEMNFDLRQQRSFFSNRDFMARDQKGNSFVRFEGGNGNVYVYDVRDGADKHIFTLSPHTFTIHNTMTIERAFIKDKAKPPDTTFSASILNFSFYFTYYLLRGKKELYKIESSSLGLKFTVYDTHRRQVAQIDRGAWEFETYNNYQLRCEPGSDTLLCLIGMVCIDIVEQKDPHDNKKKLA